MASLLLAIGVGAAQAHDQPQQQSTAAYVYLKKDAAKPASWENSTQQYLVAVWPTASYRNLTLDAVASALPEGVTLCGDGWAVQEDQADGATTVFTSKAAPSFPTDYVGWGPIFAAEHWDLSSMVKVPACATDVPTPTPTPSTPTPSTPASTPSTHTPPPSTVPVPTPTDEVLPAPSPSVPPGAEVNAAPTPSPSGTVEAHAAPSPSSTDTSEVLADDGEPGDVLAATGASPLPGLLAAVVLVLAGATLVVLRRRRA
ncbi:hypothetical protein [Cellulomonas sp. URHD0024]|uniref:hypothetical protein n=1 Tax=Cellulomonas sp. URHD0024 TaxID=1302620 RepID=UPI0018CA69D3|nr:hypothetical protein [Cellulomonas sp. URHD0024]